MFIRSCWKERGKCKCFERTLDERDSSVSLFRFQNVRISKYSACPVLVPGGQAVSSPSAKNCLSGFRPPCVQCRIPGNSNILSQSQRNRTVPLIQLVSAKRKVCVNFWLLFVIFKHMFINISALFFISPG